MRASRFSEFRAIKAAGKAGITVDEWRASRAVPTANPQHRSNAKAAVGVTSLTLVQPKGNTEQ